MKFKRKKKRELFQCNHSTNTCPQSCPHKNPHEHFLFVNGEEKEFCNESSLRCSNISLLKSECICLPINNKENK